MQTLGCGPTTRLFLLVFGGALNRAGPWLAGIAFALSFPGPAAEPALAAQASHVLVDPEAPLDGDWTHKIFGTATEYTRITLDDRPAIRALGRNSASGLYREVDYRAAEHPWLEWSWRVDRLQTSADIRTKAGQDFAAAIFLIFEERMLLMRHTSVLSYVWTNDRVSPETVVVSPYHPDTSRSVVVESGAKRLGQWVHERRNVLADYRRAFGEDPPKTVRTLALFTDSDQTGEPVEAYYGAVRAVRE